jgi:hypothetical protein
MIKRLTVFALLLLGAVNAFAENDAYNERVISSSVYVTSGDAVIANHYLSNQEYSGEISGGGARFSAMYKKSSRLSWDLDINYLNSNYSPTAENVSISNPAHTSFYSVLAVDADYGTYYNWNPVKNLSIKAGGSLDLVMGMTTGVPNHINNAADFDFQTQLKASVGIRYGWYIKNKVGIFLQANVETPFIGFTLAGSKYESSTDAVFEDEILPGSLQPFCFTSMHNLTGFNADVEAELILKKTTIFFAMEWNHRCWNLYDVQNVRNFNMSRIGLKIDIAARNRVNTNNRFF